MSRTDSENQPQMLRQDFELGFDYTRSTGPIVGYFLGALREHQIVGIRGSDGRVLVPPPEYDPDTAAALSEFVPVGSEGTVQTWCWVKKPLPNHHLQHPFAWALILLDDADTPLLHMVDAGAEANMKTGMRVCAHWAEKPEGRVTDLAFFKPLSGGNSDD